MRLLLFLFTLLCFPTFLHAQLLHSFEHLTSNTGLRATEVYQVQSDNQGYLWFCTDRGVSRYNGEDFKQFTIHDGLTDHTVFACHEDHWNRMWFICFNGSLCYYDKDTIKPYKHNDVLIKELNGIFGTAIYVDTLQGVWLRTASGLYGIDSSGQVVYNSYDPPRKKDSICIELNARYPLPYLYRNSEYLPSKISYIDNQGNKWLIDGPDRDVTYLSGALEVAELNGEYFFSDGFDLYKLDSNRNIKFVEFLGKNTRSFWTDREGNFWFGVYNYGAYCFENGDIEQKPRVFLPGNSVSSIAQDYEGSYWFTTLDNGVYYLKNENVKTFRQTPDKGTQKIIDLVADSNSIWIVFDDYKIYNKIGNGELSAYMPSRQLGIPRIGDGVIYFLAFRTDESKRSNSFCVDTKTGDILRYDRRYYYSYRAEAMGENTLVDIGYNPKDGMYMKVYENQELVRTEPLADRFYSARFTNKESDSTLLAGGHEGVYRININQKTIDSIPLGIPKKFARVNDVLTFGQDLIVASHYYGLLVIKDGKSHRLSEAEGFLSNQVNDLLLVQDTLWVSTTNGLVRIKLTSDYLESHRWSDFTRSNGLLSNDCYKTAYYQGKIWIASGLGMSILKADWNKEEMVPPRLTLEGVRVNSKRYKTADLLDLGYQENNLRIDLEAIGFHNREDYKYYYRLNAADSNWEVSSQGKINLASLAPGEYLFEAYVNNGNRNSEGFVQLPIRIFPPFWKTGWFIILSFLILSSLTTAFFWYRFRVQQEAHKLEHSRKMAEAEKQMAEERLQIVNLENELLDSKVKWQQQRLVSRLMEGSAKNELFSQLKKELHALLVLDKRKRQSKTRELINLINQYGSSDATWKEFHDQFDQVHPGFYEKLAEISSELTTNDLRYCSLIRMNMNAKEIAGILNISPDTVRIARYRLKKKLGMPAEERLNSYLMRI
ncbi:hypothetical protein KFE98_19715 [bacterium SCSIO 12741]|nr:hypothetical protein KFE98_19715 [bacterium SCSIO 12741]